MVHPTVTIQISPESQPSTPSWLGEVAAFAQVLTHQGLLTAIQEHVRFARARFGKYDTIDFVVVLIGYTLLGLTFLTNLRQCNSVPEQLSSALYSISNSATITIDRNSLGR